MQKFMCLFSLVLLLNLNCGTRTVGLGEACTRDTDCKEGVCLSTICQRGGSERSLLELNKELPQLDAGEADVLPQQDIKKSDIKKTDETYREPITRELLPDFFHETTEEVTRSMDSIVSCDSVLECKRCPTTDKNFKLEQYWFIRLQDLYTGVPRTSLLLYGTSQLVFKKAPKVIFQNAQYSIEQTFFTPQRLEYIITGLEGLKKPKITLSGIIVTPSNVDCPFTYTFQHSICNNKTCSCNIDLQCARGTTCQKGICCHAGTCKP